MQTKKKTQRKNNSLTGMKPISKKEVKEFYKTLNSSPLTRSFRYSIRLANIETTESISKQTSNAGV